MTAPLHVLIVDNSERDAGLILRELKKAKYKVHYKQVATAKDMIAALSKQAWDIVISEYKLQKFNAAAALKLLQKKGLDIPFIIVSHILNEETAIALIQSGASDYLMKDKLARLAPVVKRELTDAGARQKHKWAEESLHENEERFRRIFEAGPLGMTIISSDFHFTKVNAMFCKMMGYKERELLSMTFKDITHPDHVADDVRSLKKLIKGKLSVYRTEKRYLRKDQQSVWGAVTATVIRDKNGQFQYLLVMIEDITERKRAEEAILQKGEQFKILFMSMSEGFYLSEILYDDNGNPCDYRYIEINPKFEQIMGLRRDQIIRKRYKELVPVDTTGWLDNYLKVARTGESSIYEFYSKEYQKYFQTYSYQPAKNQVTVLVVDVSERKQAEEALRESESKFKTIFESSSDAIMLLTEKGFSDCNPCTMEMFGFKRKEDFIGTLPSDISPLTQPDGTSSIEASRKQMEAAFRNGSNRFEWMHRRVNGENFVAEVLLSAVEYGGKKVLQATVRDITERRRIEESLQLFSHTVKSISECVSITDLNNIILFVNQAFIATYGYQEEELIGKSIYIVRAENPPSEDVILRNTLKGEWKGELLNRKKDGTVFLVSISTSVVYDEKGLPVALVGVATDIADRKRAEDDLRRAAEDTHTIFWQAGVIKSDDETQGAEGFIWNTHYTNLDIVDKFIPFPDYPSHDLADRFYYSWLEEDRKAMDHKSADALRRGLSGYNQEFRLRDVNGVIHWMYEDVHIHYLSDKQYEVVGVTIDNTVRKITEEALHESEERYRTMIENSNDLIQSVAPDGRILFVNPIWRNTMGFIDDEVTRLNFFDVIHPDSLSHCHTLFEKVLKGTAVPYMEATFVAKDGRMVYLEGNAAPRILDGKVIATQSFFHDITERKKAEKALKESEEFLQASVQIANLGIFNHDHRTDTIYWSPRQREIHQLSPDESVTMQMILEIIYLFDRTSIDATIRQAHNPTGNGLWNVEYRIRRRDGSIRWLAAQSQTFFEGDGETRHPVRTVGATLDITERKQAEETLRESESKYREMVEQINDVLYTTDINGRITYMSPTIETLGGYKQNEMIGHYIFEFLDPVYIPKMKEQFSKILAGNLEPTEYRIKTKSGEYIWVRNSSKPIIEKGQPVGMRGVMTDISARKQAEESLNLLSHTVKSITECVNVTDLNNTILFVNQAFLNTYGYEEDEVIGKPIDIISLPDVSNNQEIMNSTLKGEWRGELINRKKDGTEFPLYLSTSAVFDEYGRAVALVGVATDITDQKKMQQQLLQAQKMESVGTLAGGIAHDFNNILGIILGYSTLMQRETMSPEKFHENLGIINNAVGRGAALVRQILTFARKTDIVFEPMSVTDMVHELLSMLMQTFPKVITIIEDVDKSLPFINADRTQIHQVLLNLCVNARDAMPNGGLIVIKAEKLTKDQLQKINLPANHDSYICISVTDTGEGMDEAIRRQIFDPFFTTKEKGKGTGLGLAVVYGVVQSHHGFIDVESVVGRGTTFRLYFPAPVLSEQTMTISALAESFDTGGTETILLVEDEDALKEIVRLLLESKGYKVHTAQEGKEAIKVYIQYKQEIALVLTDMGLPGMTGADVFKKLKDIDPKVNVVFASGFFEPDVKTELDKAGAKGFIQKPYSPDEVLRILREVLDKKKK